jgi:hypothetical protein
VEPVSASRCTTGDSIHRSISVNASESGVGGRAHRQQYRWSSSYG